MAWMLSPDVTRYLVSAGGFLRSRPAEHSVLLTVTEAVRLGGPATFGDEPPLFGWYVQGGGPVTAACLHTPPYPVALTAMPDLAAAALASSLAGSGRMVAGVGGPPGPARAFAAAWQRQTGQPARVSRHERLYRLGELVPPDPAVAGQARIGPVYTPPAHRGRGYGGAVTTAVSQQALAAGVTEVLLYTDLANPTSNALYQRLGYQPVADSVQLRFMA
jgi:GNAT superfamily N-acetyltransferase